MNWKILLVTLLSVTMLMSTVFTSCKLASDQSPNPPPVSSQSPTPPVSSQSPNPTPIYSLDPGEEFEIIRQAADAWLNSGKTLFLTAKELYDSIMAGIGLTDYKVEWYDPLVFQSAPLIVDVRGGDSEMPDAYLAGHIPGSFAIPWREVADVNYLRKLDKGRQIAIVSSTGQTGAIAAAILGVLGYDTINLMYGMTAWTSDPIAAPGRYDKERDTVWNWRGSYRVISSEPSETYLFPVVENTKSTDKFEIIRAAALAYLHSGKRENMSAQELYHSLHFAEILNPLYFFTNPVSPMESPFTVPFLLDVRDDESYANGHLYGALHFYYKDLFKLENLKRLPPDRQILVYSDNGHESGAVTALLNMLGYDAINLKWGIAGSLFIEERDCINAAIVKGFRSFLPCPA